MPAKTTMKSCSSYFVVEVDCNLRDRGGGKGCFDMCMVFFSLPVYSVYGENGF